jgi:hypothetical protein
MHTYKIHPKELCTPRVVRGKRGHESTQAGRTRKNSVRPAS